MNIKERIEQFASRKKKPRGKLREEGVVRVEFEFSPPYGVMRKVNRALERADEEERFSLTIDLFRLWVEAGVLERKKRQKEARDIFGKFFKDHGKKWLMCTATDPSYIPQQLRVWHGIPAYIEWGHVDCASTQNLLFGVYGDPKIISRYLKAICGVYRLKEVRLPNDVRLYINWYNLFEDTYFPHP